MNLTDISLFFFRINNENNNKKKKTSFFFFLRHRISSFNGFTKKQQLLQFTQQPIFVYKIYQLLTNQINCSIVITLFFFFFFFEAFSTFNCSPKNLLFFEQYYPKNSCHYFSVSAQFFGGMPVGFPMVCYCWSVTKSVKQYNQCKIIINNLL